MNQARLDRLSALLEGLAPAVSMAAGESAAGLGQGGNPGDGEALCLYLLTAGAMAFRAGGSAHRVAAPAIVACRPDLPHTVEALPPTAGQQLVRARAALSGPTASLFLEAFAQPQIVPVVADEPALQFALSLIAAELDAPRCGQPALLDRAGDILFIGLLRHLVAHPPPAGSGLFNGLADARIARALVAIHQRPAFGWNLERLAQQAGMSRTSFAATFRQVMRRTPGKYLSAVRLAIARRAVQQGRGLKQAARAAGYADASALSRALSRARVAA